MENFKEHLKVAVSDKFAVPFSVLQELSHNLGNDMTCPVSLTGTSFTKQKLSSLLDKSHLGKIKNRDMAGKTAYKEEMVSAY